MSTPPIIVMGPPGAGKSSTSRALAEILRGEVIDTDHLVEEECGKRISEIFTEDGEAFFRAREEEAVLRALDGVRGIDCALSPWVGAPSSRNFRNLDCAPVVASSSISK